MRDPLLASRIVEAMANKVQHPVTVKMRRGFAYGEDRLPPSLPTSFKSRVLLQLRSMDATMPSSSTKGMPAGKRSVA